MLAALSAFALNASADVTRPLAAAPPPVVSAGSLLQVGAALMLVLASVAAVAWVLKRMSPGQAAFGGAVRVVSATAVGQRERVVLVEVEGTWLVLGVAPGHVSTLHTLPKPAMPATNGASAPPDNKFAGWLKQTLERRRHG
jgi:flagellar protein FliO/FliZ